jgi:hypothetical protein
LRAQAEVYRAGHKLGYTPQQMDDMEVWQLAAILEVDLEPDWEPTEADKERLERIQQPTETMDITAQALDMMGIRPKVG